MPGRVRRVMEAETRSGFGAKFAREGNTNMSLAAGGILMLTGGDVVEGETGILGGLGKAAAMAGAIVRVGGSGLRSDDRPKK